MDDTRERGESVEIVRGSAGKQRMREIIIAKGGKTHGRECVSDGGKQKPEKASQWTNDRISRRGVRSSEQLLADKKSEGRKSKVVNWKKVIIIGTSDLVETALRRDRHKSTIPPQQRAPLGKGAIKGGTER